MSESTRITLDVATKLYSELREVETLNRREVVIHTGKHTDCGCIALIQWGSDDFYTLIAMNDGELIPLTMRADDFYTMSENAL